MSEMHGHCSFCSLACPLVFLGGERGPIFGQDSVLALDWDKSGDSKYGGSLCARGNAVIEFITHADRLNYPFVLGERSTLDAAIVETAKNLAAVKEESGGNSIGLLLGDNLTNEEAALCVRFAREVLGTDNIALFAPDDIPLFRAHLACDLSEQVPAGGKPAGDREVTLVIGDSFAEHPCTAKIVLPSKYGTRGSEVIVISPELNHTAWFANRHLNCRPGGEAAVAAGLLKAAAGTSGATLEPELKTFVEGIEWSAIEMLGGVPRDDIAGAAGSMLGASKVRTYISNIFGRIGEPALTSLLAEAVTRICPGEREFNPQFVQQNTWGIYSTIAKSGNGKVLQRLEGDDLKALIILGLDIFSVYPADTVEDALREKKFTVSTQLFWGQTAARANVVIPAAGLIEKKGTVSPAFGDMLVRDKTIPPPGGTVTDEEFLVKLAREMGFELSPASAAGEPPRRGKSCGPLADDWSAYREMMGALDAADTVLIPWSEPVHVADGSLSRNLHWSDVTVPEPVLVVSRDLAEERNLANGERVTVSTEGGEASLTVKVSGKVEGNVVGATIHFPAVRKLFPWKLDPRHGEIVLNPVPVTVSGRSGKG
jgi:NADH-quinone oxidoreductase subunit G